MSRLLSADAISPVFHEQFIVNGYRSTDTSFWQCIKYAFVLHNDFGNIWTHVIPFIAWIIWLYYTSLTIDFTDPYWYPLLAIWIGACCCVFCSAMAHLLACKSLMTHQVASMIDYLGITMYCTGGFLAYYFYERQTEFSLLTYKWMLILLCVFINTMATLTCSLSRFYWRKYRYVARSGSYVLPYILALLPFTIRFLYCIGTGEQCEHQTLHLHIIAVILSLLEMFFFVSKVPERFSPGLFDYIFHSHQLFHILVASMITLQLYFVMIDGINRHGILTSDPYLVPDLYSTLVPFVAVFILGFGIVGVLSYLVFTGVLISNKTSKKQRNFS